MMRFVIFILVLLLPGAALAEENCVLSDTSGACVDKTLYADATITLEGSLALIQVHITNSGNETRELLTGRAGEYMRGEFREPYNLDALTGEDTGSGELAVPALAFGGLTLTAPRPLPSGHTFRNMAPTILTLAPGDKKHYCSFSVPAQHVAGEFRYGLIAFPAENSAGTPVKVDIRKAARPESPPGK